MSGKGEKSSGLDIFKLLTETTEKEKRKRREELLAPLGVKEFFADGSISVNKKTCQGVECKLCIEACPTNALFWRAGEVGITRELCVLSCIVDDCIKVVRKRVTGEVERFSKPREFLVLQHDVNVGKRCQRVRDVFPKAEDYLE